MYYTLFKLAKAIAEQTADDQMGLVPKQPKPKSDYLTNSFSELFATFLSKSSPSPKLPKFKYHEDPVATGSIEKSNAKCDICGQRMGYIYVGPQYHLGSNDYKICPQCIANGKAHKKVGVEFSSDVGKVYGWGSVNPKIEKIIKQRTPGYNAWQTNPWWTHCGDAAVYVGKYEFGRSPKPDPEILEQVREACGESPELWQQLINDGAGYDVPTMYIFRCRHCGKYGGHWDFA